MYIARFSHMILYHLLIPYLIYNNKKKITDVS